jgi:DNA-binding transcriptional MerR regulator
MNELSEEELDEFEKRHPTGISSSEIVEVFEQRGFKFSEATLRKYVQLGLLPRSIRVGRKGKHKGSQGMYPASIIRQIQEIKRLLNENKTIDEIRNDYFLLRSDIETVEQSTERLFDRVEHAIDGKRDDATAEAMRRDLRLAREAAESLLDRLRSIEGRLAARADLVRDAAKTA